MDLYRFGAECALARLGFEKTALSRLDKEVQKGNVTYRDVDPTMHPLLARTRKGKERTRAQAMAGTQSAPEDLARQRSMRKAIHRNEHALGDRYRAMAKQGPLPNQEAEDYAKTFNSGEPSISVDGDIYAPDTSGQQIRQTGERNEAFKHMTPEEKETYVKGYVDDMFSGKGKAEPALPDRVGADDTLDLAAMRHEQGERSAMRGDTQHAHATHAGVEPIVQEDLHMIGDVDAQNAMGKVRVDEDNALVTRLKKQMGFHPDNPLPLGGKQQTALENRLAEMGHKIEPERMDRNFSDQRKHYKDFLGAGEHKNKPLTPSVFDSLLQGKGAPKHIATIPQEAQAALRQEAVLKHNANVANTKAWDALPPKRTGALGFVDDFKHHMLGIGGPKMHTPDTTDIDKILRKFTRAR